MNQEQEFIVHSPLSVKLPRKTKEDVKWTLNLNTYRNAKYFASNQAKTIYEQVMSQEIDKLPQFEYLSEVQYIIHKKDHQRFDPPNYAAVVSKFFMDALVNAGKLPDDSYKYSPRHVIDIGTIGQKNECTIILRGKPMKHILELDFEDIFKYVKNGLKADGVNIDPCKLVFKDTGGGHIVATADLSITGSEPVKECPIQAEPENTTNPEPVQTIPEPEKQPTPVDENPLLNRTVRRRRRVNNTNIQEEFNNVSTAEPDVSQDENVPFESDAEEKTEEDTQTEPEEEVQASEEEVEQVVTNTWGNTKYRRR